MKQLSTILFLSLVFGPAHAEKVEDVKVIDIPSFSAHPSGAYYKSPSVKVSGGFKPPE